MPLTTVLSPPDVSDNELNPEDKRLWLGNLDPRITEYQLLKLLQKFGTIEKFDLLFHKTGPLAGQPRGYAFVTYTHREDAQSLMNAVHGKVFGSKNVTVRWARNMTKAEIEKKPKGELKIPALVGAKEEKKISREIQIQAIESKLKMMEHNSADDLLFSNEPSTSSGSGHLHKRTSDQSKQSIVPYRSKTISRNRILPYTKR